MTNGNGNGGKALARTVAIVTAAAAGVGVVGAGVGVALRLQGESHSLEMAIAAVSDRLAVVEKRVGPGGWSHSDMHVYNALLKAVAGHEVPDLNEID